MGTGDIIEHTDYGKGIILGEDTIIYDDMTCDCCDNGAHVVLCYKTYFFDTSNEPYDYWNMVASYNPTKRSSQKSFVFTARPMIVKIARDSVKLYNAKP